MKNKYTFDFVNVQKFKNKLIEVEADNLEEAKEKILLLLTKERLCCLLNNLF